MTFLFDFNDHDSNNAMSSEDEAKRLQDEEDAERKLPVSGAG